MPTDMEGCEAVSSTCSSSVAVAHRSNTVLAEAPKNPSDGTNNLIFEFRAGNKSICHGTYLHLQ